MKKMIGALMVVGLAAVPALAHPPSAIDIKINGTRVEVIITHDVKDPKAHYIDDVEVGLGRKDLIEQKCLEQTDDKTQVVVYSIPGLKSGDVVNVEADCNRGGDLKSEARAP